LKPRAAHIGIRTPFASKEHKIPLLRSGCLYPLLGFLLIYASYVLILLHLIPDPVVPYVFSLFTAIGTGALVTGFLALFQSRKLAGAIQRNREGTPRRDGRFEAATGAIYPLQEALSSPLQGRSCVAYEYDVAITGKEGQTAGSAAWGWALTPAVIRSPEGDMRLLGFPELERFDQAVVGEGARERIQQYFQATTFVTIGERALNKALGQILERSADDDGQVRADVLRGTELDPKNIRLEGRQWTERVVPVGEEVTAFGYYSASREGLVPNSRKISETVQLWPGKGEELTAVIEKESSGRITVGIVLFIITHAFMSIIFFIMWLKGSHG
jgi:hypothetical protein